MLFCLGCIVDVGSLEPVNDIIKENRNKWRNWTSALKLLLQEVFHPLWILLLSYELFFSTFVGSGAPQQIKTRYVRWVASQWVLTRKPVAMCMNSSSINEVQANSKPFLPKLPLTLAYFVYNLTFELHDMHCNTTDNANWAKFCRACPELVDGK